MSADIVLYYFLTNKVERDGSDKTKVSWVKKRLENDCLTVIKVGSFSKWMYCDRFLKTLSLDRYYQIF